jgi:hypothetical protein
MLGFSPYELRQDDWNLRLFRWLARSTMARDRPFFALLQGGEISPPNLRWVGRNFGDGGI